ncbi:MAG: pro-sigmaK processing inhibitor BofA family protein [Clostridiales bacterium]
MQLWQSLLLLAGGLVFVFVISVMPQKFFRVVGRFLGNAVLGLLLLFLINVCAGWTDVLLPVNGLTLAVSGVLGVPGVVALAVISAV